jgi:hypothetical protein
VVSALDSFLVYLNTQLAAAAITVHWVRQDPSNDTAHLLQENALNVAMLTADQSGNREEILVSLDLVGSDERTVLGQAETIRDVLLQTQYAAESSYSANPLSPQSLGRLVSWSGDDVKWTTVAKNARLIQMNCTMPLLHVRS